MKFTAMLDVNVVAHETDDDVTVLLELEAPAAPDTGEERPANTLQVVLDRSGSMAGGPLRGARSTRWSAWSPSSTVATGSAWSCSTTRPRWWCRAGR